jgi:hypothetical protein
MSQPSQSAVGRLLSGTVWVDITASGTLDLSTNRFTTANNLVSGLFYQF